MTVPLVAVAHGSRDPRSARTIHGLVDAVRALRPELDVRTAFLDLSAPRLGDVLDAVRGDGHQEAVVVPLLLGKAFHARVDVPAAVAEIQQRHPVFRVHVSDVLGPDQNLDRAAWRRLVQAGADPDDPDLGVVLAGAGSSHAPANQLVADVADRWAKRTAWTGAGAAFAAAAQPDVPEAVARLRAAGASRFAIGSWFLAPGLLPDRIIRQAGDCADDLVIAHPMGDDPNLAELIVRRYTGTLADASSHRTYAHAQ